MDMTISVITTVFLLILAGLIVFKLGRFLFGRMPVFFTAFIFALLFDCAVTFNFWLAVLLFAICIGLIVKIGYSKEAINYRKGLQT